MVNDVLSDLDSHLAKALEGLKRELAKVRTGRANLAILDGVRIDYYGQATPLNQVAAVQVADPRLITIKPWEKKLCTDIERAVRAHGWRPGQMQRVSSGFYTSQAWEWKRI